MGAYRRTFHPKLPRDDKQIIAVRKTDYGRFKTLTARLGKTMVELFGKMVDELELKVGRETPEETKHERKEARRG
jgi:hypothetical protein